MQISVPIPGLAVVQTYSALSTFLAICIAILPTPPAPPGMKTLLPALTPPRLMLDTQLNPPKEMQQLQKN